MIEINKADITFGGGFGEGKELFTAVKDLTFTIPEGCIYGFLGSNGAGKSTLMRAMCGVYKLNKGSIKIDGEEVYNNPKALENIFFVNDETVQYSNFTIKDLKNYYKNYYSNFSSDTFDRLVKEISLPTNKKLSAFSKGMKRQAIVIAGLACKTKYLMLDEAFDGLDPAMRKIVKKMIIDEIVDNHSTLIVSSHNLTEISELCDRAMLIYKGELVFADEIDNIRSGFCKIQAAFKDNINIELFESKGLKIMQYSQVGSIVNMVLKGSADENIEKLADFDNKLLEAIPLTLEEIFIYELEARGYGKNILE